MDSSLVLSAACRAAERAGSEPPLPLTLRFGGLDDRDRTHQDEMIEWLGLTDWTIIDVADELDLVGPSATRELDRYGLMHAARLPGRAWWLEQIADSGGTGSNGGDPHRDLPLLLNGEGGDEVLGSAPHATRHALRYAVRTGRFRRQALAVAAHRAADVLPSRRSQDPAPPWLTALGRTRRDTALRLERRRTSTMRDFVIDYRSRRALVASQEQLERQAARHGFLARSPLLDIDLLAQFGAIIPEPDHINRPMIVQRHFSELLPPRIAQRTDKVYFGPAVFNAHTRIFAEEWDGASGVPLDLVDPDALRAAWRDGSDARCGLLLQSARRASGSTA